MLQGERLSSDIPPSLDVPIFKQLIAGSKDLPAAVQKEWNAFRHQQQRITIDMGYMYEYYKAFIPLLFDPKVKNLLLLDTIVHLFPNVTEIICENTDNITGGYDHKNYSADIVSSNFILRVKERLSKLDKHAKLTKIVIQTRKHEIKDDGKLYAPQFGALGWKIGKRSDGKTIVLTQEAYDGMYKDVIPKISAMLQGEELSNNIPPALDVPIFKQLIAGSKDIPANVQKEWHKLTHQQQRIIIDMSNMYHYYKAFIPLLYDRKVKNLLLLDTIVHLFPNVTEIICKNTDIVSEEREYSSDIVCSNFILRVKERLSTLDKHAKLTKIVIQTRKHEIKDNCKLYAPQFGALGWKIGKGAHTIVLTKEAYDVICKEVIAKIKSMIQGEGTSYEANSLDVSIFKQLITGSKDVPADVQKQWDEFRVKQQIVHIHMYWMCKFIPVLSSPDPKLKNLLLFDKIIKIFPNATEIICTSIDCINEHREPNASYLGTCSSSIVSPNFILGVKERLSKIDKHVRLKKIIIKTFKYEIDINLYLYIAQFRHLGWQVQRGSYKNDAWGTANKNNQITLTRLKGPNTRLPNGPPALSEANENNPNGHQSVDNAVFDLD